MIWLVPSIPIAAGFLLCFALGEKYPHGVRRRLGAGAVLALAATLAVALWAAATDAASVWSWTSLLQPSLDALDESAIVAVLVPVVALPVAIYAVAHEPRAGLARQVGLIVAFVGAMEMLVLAADLFTLIVGWELVSAISWGLIAHEWRSQDKPRAAAHAFNVTKLGSLGLFLAAGAAVASVGSLSFAELADIEGGWMHALATGVVLAAATKSAQVPFSPWLYSAMGGPTPVSALLHSATMVAAGAYLLIRLHDVLQLVDWFQPVTIALGIVTALAGGLAAALQAHIKKLLAASTSAQYGLMFVAVGAGYPVAALVHLVAHALFKSQLFLAAGLAISASGTEEIRRMRLGRSLPRVALLAGIAVLALAAVPPLGAAWTKEQVVAAAGHYGGWLAIVVAVAGALSALYAARFQLLAFGRAPDDDGKRFEPEEGAFLSVAVLAGLTVLAGALWIPGVGERIAEIAGGSLPRGKPWETAVSLLLVAAAAYAAWGFHRSERLERLGAARREALADWFGIPPLARRGIVGPFLAVSRQAAVFDDRVIDAGAKGAAAFGRSASGVFSRVGELAFDRTAESLASATRSAAGALSVVWESIVDRAAEGTARATGFVARDASKSQTGLLHHYYVYVVVGIVILVLTAALWR